MSVISPTPSQEVALRTFQTFLNGDGQVYILKGAAGTGKTVLAGMFIDTLRAQGREFHLMAPTGRAAFVLGNKVGFDAFTIHKSIYSLSQLESQNPTDDESDNDVHARFSLRHNDDARDAVYLVDEASMVSDNFSQSEAFTFGSGRLLHDLFHYAGGRKIVFIGDYAQLPPVGMSFSPALDTDYLHDTFGTNVESSKLTEVVRQGQDSGILSNVTRIRDSIDHKSFIEFKLTESFDFHAEDTSLLPRYFELSPTRPTASATIIAYTNKQVLQYNELIRAHYYGDHAPRLMSGELLMIARNNYAHDVELFNGNIVRVVSCQPDNEVERRTVRVKTGKDRIDSVELSFRKAVIAFKAGNERAELSVKLLDNFLDEVSSTVSGLLSRALIVDFNNRLPNVLKDNLPAIKKALRQKQEPIGELRQLCETYKELLLHDPYYNSVACKYGYAVTCHKAQGGEWDNVFVDMSRFGGTANEDYFRWAYTALTRSSKQVWHHRSPDFDYISGIVVEPIQKSGNIKVSIHDGEADFCQSRYERIKEIACSFGVTVNEDRSRDYQQWFSFADDEGNTATFVLWFNKVGYTDKTVLRHSTSDDFTALCKQILERSFAPGFIPFSAPKRPFAEKLNRYIISIIDELDIQLLNITQDQYHDTYHLKTDGLAKIEMYYSGKGNYTYMKCISSMGSEDKKLEELRKRFI